MRSSRRWSATGHGWACRGSGSTLPFFLADTAKSPDDDVTHPHDYLKDLRSFLSRRSGDAVLMGEVNLPYDQQRRFFGDDDGDGTSDGNELMLQFDFVGMQQMYLALARQDATPLVTTLASRPPIPRDAQWATFVRNHDELTLDKLSDDERAEVFAAFGPEPDMQLYGRGLRRRLPPMLGGDPRRLRMVYSLLFSLPGTPVLFYGEEIGMGENLDVPGRFAVRTPMQWTSGPNGGFSRAPARRLAAPLPGDGYAPEHVNVADQRRDPESLLTFVRMLAHRYRECPELGWGDAQVLDSPEPSVLALRTTWQDASMVTLHNLSPDPVVVRVPLGDLPEDARLVDVLDADDVEPAPDGTAEVRLDGYGFRWLRVTPPGSRRLL